MSAHTPGPWAIGFSSSGYPYEIRADHQCGIKGAIRSVIRWAGIGLPSSPQALANAHLITAAPELLAACKACMENDGDWVPLMSAAIDKAEGR